MQQEMPILRYGHWGPALLLFPTWQADAWEAEQKGLIDALADRIDQGRLTVFCVNSVSGQAWCNEAVEFPEKGRRQAAYSGYIEEEVAPHIRRVLQDASARIAVGGASFGAFYAANAVFRRPDLFWALIGMSGFYKLDRMLHGYSDENVYFHSPGWFVPNLPEGPLLDRLRKDTRIQLLAGRGAWEEPQQTEEFARILTARGIPHWLEVWGDDVPHEWPSWQRMLQVAVDRLGW